MENLKQVFQSGNGLRVTITLVEGKSGFNLKSTIKGIEKGGPRAVTGTRHNYDNEADGKKAYAKVVKEFEAKDGWEQVTVRSKNAFVEALDPAEAMALLKSKGTASASTPRLRKAKGKKEKAVVTAASATV